MVHHIEQSLRPNLIGTAELRFPTFDGDHVFITYKPIGVGQTGRRRAVWERATRASLNSPTNQAAHQKRDRYTLVGAVSFQRLLAAVCE